MDDTYTLYQGDCLDILPTLEAGSVDAVITDLPYGTTACAWDEIIPFAPMWAGVKWVLKPRGAFVTTASQPFTSKLVMSNFDWFRYEWLWIKNHVSNIMNCQYMPLKNHENVLVFSESKARSNQFTDERVNYYPQGLSPCGIVQNGKSKQTAINNTRGNTAKQYTRAYTNYPQTTLYFDTPLKTTHPTQKPVALMEYLIKTYTNEGDTVLDICMGSGTTGKAALQTGRNFIGIELDPDYFRIAEQRIKNAAGDFVVTDKEKTNGKVSLFDWAQNG